MKTQKILLTLMFLLVGLGANSLFAQTAPTVDTVCAGATGVKYYVNPTVGSTYKWTVKGGTQVSGGTGDSIAVDWSTSSGLDTLIVVETNAGGCIGDTVMLPVYRMPLPTATITGTDTICYNFTSLISISLTGSAPWSVTYSDGTTQTTVNNITTSPYTFSTPKLASSTTYSLVSVSNSKGCGGSVSGSAAITVTPKPTTSKIFRK
jgi:hypothetical protein